MQGKRAADTTPRWFWVFAIGHLILWTVVPVLTQKNSPLDNIEMLYWGHEWQWGYSKHPPLPAWSAETIAILLGDPVWATYLLSQICIVGCFWAAWKLGREVLRPWQSLAAAIVLETSIYYNCTTPEFNNNIMAKVCWAFFALFLYFGMTRGRLIFWAMSGVFLGAAFLCKYDVALLFIAVLLFSIASSRARACWRTAGPYVLAGAAFLLFAPHLGWLIAHDFVTFRYALSRFSGDPSWFSHVSFPAEFLGAQFASVGIVLLVSTIPLGWRWRIKPAEGVARFHRAFVAWIVLGPLAVALFFSACTGAHIRSMWGAPMFTFLGVLLFTWFEAKPDEAFLRRAIYTSVVVGMAFAIGLACRNLFGGSLRNRPLRVDFPGKRLAMQVERIWSDRKDAPLKHVGGNAWVAANVSVYHPLRPSVFAELDENLSPWVDDQAWRRDGGVVLWDVEQFGDIYARRVRERFPSAEFLPPLELAWEKMPHRSPLRIGIAVVPTQRDPLPKVVERPAGQNR